MAAPLNPECPSHPVGVPLVVSLVLTLSNDAALACAAEHEVASMPGIVLGDRSGPWLTLVAESDDLMGLHRRLEAVQGVAYVDVAFVEMNAAHETLSSRDTALSGSNQ